MLLFWKTTEQVCLCHGSWSGPSTVQCTSVFTYAYICYIVDVPSLGSCWSSHTACVVFADLLVLQLVPRQLDCYSISQAPTVCGRTKVPVNVNSEICWQMANADTTTILLSLPSWWSQQPTIQSL